MASFASLLICAASIQAQSLTHRYSFNETAGSTTFADSVAAADGSVYNDPLFPSSATLDGSQLVLTGEGGYGTLPAPLINAYSEVTIEFWATFSPANPVWTRTFFFGDQNISGQKATGFDYSHYVSGDWQNLDLATPSGGLYANNPGGLNGRTNVHVTCVVNPAGNQMFYYNDVTLKSTQHGTVPALSGINEVFAVIGKSPFDVDATLAGSINEFRIYSGVVPRSQVALNDAAGPNSYITSPGTLVSVSLASPDNPLTIGQVSKQIFKGDFTAVTGLDLAAYGGATFTSQNTSVLTINSEGVVTAVTPGTTTIVASYGGMSKTNSLTVVAIPAVLKHRYSFATDATDSIGGAHGTLVDGATVSGGKAVLAGGFSGQYIDLPGNVVNIATNKAITIECWVDFGDVPTWCRLWNFGATNLTGGGINEIYFAPRVLTGGEHWISQNISGGQTTGWNKNYGNTSAHLAFIMDPATGVMAVYKNGVLEYARYDATASLSLVATNLAVIGKSLVAADQYMPGSIDEFRIYSGSLTPQEIARSYAAGPNTISRDPGTLNSITVSPVTYPVFSRDTTPVVLANYANLPGFNLLPNSSARVPSLSLTSSDTNILVIRANNLIRTFGPGEATLSATYLGKTHNAVVKVGSSGAQLTHRYSFDSDASDSVGAAHGTLQGTASVSGGKLVLNGATGGTAPFVDLPGGLVTDYSGITIDVWADLGPGANWGRLWFFGNYRDGEFYCAPATSIPSHRFSTGYSFGIGNGNIDAPGSLQNQSAHITCVYGQGTMGIYTNGVLDTVVTVSGRPEQIGQTFFWIGQSPWPDPYLEASVDEFRIYNGRLSPQEIQASQALGPSALLSMTPPALSAAVGGGNVTLKWPAAAAGFTVQANNNLATGSWTVVTNAPSLVGSDWQLSLPASSANFFRLWR